VVCAFGQELSGHAPGERLSPEDMDKTRRVPRERWLQLR
jgi:hypothetical protein